MAFEVFTSEIPANFKPGQALQDVPMTELVTSLGRAVADAQLALDANSIKTAIKLGTNTVELTDAAGKTTSRSLLALGFTPNFYHFESATISVSVTVSLKLEESVGFQLKFGDPSVPPGETAPAASAKVTVTVTDVTKLAAGDALIIGKNQVEFIAAGATPADGKPQIAIPAKPSDDKKAKAAEDLATSMTALLGKEPFSKEIKAKAEANKITIEAASAGSAPAIEWKPKGAAAPTAGVTVSGATLAGGDTSAKAKATISVKDIKAVAAGDKLTIGDGVVSFVTGTPTGNEVKIGTDAKALAKDIADVVTKNDPFKALVTATAAEADVTIEAQKDGKDGNSIKLAFEAKAAAGGGSGAITVTGKLGAKDDGKTGDTASGGASGAGGGKKGDLVEEKTKVLKSWGISVSADYHRKFSIDTTSTTKIDARLVSVPAPAAFMDMLRTTFGGAGGGG